MITAPDFYMPCFECERAGCTDCPCDAKQCWYNRELEPGDDEPGNLSKT